MSLSAGGRNLREQRREKKRRGEEGERGEYRKQVRGRNKAVMQFEDSLNLILSLNSGERFEASVFSKELSIYRRSYSMLYRL